MAQVKNIAKKQMPTKHMCIYLSFSHHACSSKTL